MGSGQWTVDTQWTSQHWDIWTTSPQSKEVRSGDVNLSLMFYISQLSLVMINDQLNHFYSPVKRHFGKTKWEKTFLSALATGVEWPGGELHHMASTEVWWGQGGEY